MIEVKNVDLFYGESEVVEVPFEGESYFFTLRNEDDVIDSASIFVDGVVNRNKKFSGESENIISVKEIKDKFDCDVCGFTSAIGWKLLFNGVEDTSLEPLAHCYDDKHFTFTDLFVKLLKLHGLEVVWRKD